MRWFVALALCVSALAQTSAEMQRQSAEKQREAAEIQRQATRAQIDAPFASPPDTPPRPASVLSVSAPCDPLSDETVSALVDIASKEQDLQPALLRAVIERESGFRPCAVSAKGARGLMQLMPATATQFGVKDSFDPAQNVATGAKYFKQLLDRFKGDLTLALSAYNAGPAAVEQAGGIPDFAETRDYVKAILEKAGIKRTAPPSIPTPRPTEN